MSDYSELGARLAAYVTARTPDQINFCVESVTVAAALVNEIAFPEGPRPIPEEVLERAYIMVGAELFNQKDTKNGVSQFAAADGGAIRVARDPLIPARAILAPWLVGGFA